MYAAADLTFVDLPEQEQYSRLMWYHTVSNLLLNQLINGDRLGTQAFQLASNTTLKSATETAVARTTFDRNTLYLMHGLAATLQVSEHVQAAVDVAIATIAKG